MSEPTRNVVEPTTLLPCPFCGGEAEVRYHPSCMRDPSHRSWEVGCSICDARVGNTVYAIGKTRDEAIAAWNRRANGTTKLRELVRDVVLLAGLNGCDVTKMQLHAHGGDWRTVWERMSELGVPGTGVDHD